MEKCKHCGDSKCLKTGFCCLGCEVAYKLINSLRLDKYYEYCSTIYNSRPMKVHDIKNSLDYMEYVQLQDGVFKINLIVEGIHCGSCIWLIESTLRKDPAIKNARVNMSTRRLVIEWAGDKEHLNALVDTIFKLGYKLIPFTPDASEDEAIQNEKNMLKYLGVSGLVSISLMMIVFGVWAGNFDHSMGTYTRSMIHILMSMMAIPAIIYSGMPFYRSAWSAIKGGHTNMDVPIAIGVICATLISIQETIYASAYTYYDAAISLIFFLLIGRYLDMKFRNKARQFARNLMLSQPKTITLFQKGKLVLSPINKAKKGDIAFVAVGERIPADGVIVEGNTDLDTSIISGESMPVSVGVGARVVTGSINMNAPIKIQITALADDTLLGEIIRLMENAEQGRAQYVRIADKLAGYFTPITLGLAILTFVIWVFIMQAPINIALLYAVSLLIITCPCALGLAVPAVQIISSGRLMSQGIIIKSQDALEKLAQIDTVVFDKTGTLTRGVPELVNADEIDKKSMQIAASLAAFSQHPLCKSIATATPIKFDSDVSEEKGMGVSAKLDGKVIKLGKRSWCGVDTQDNDEYMEMWFKHGSKKAVRLKFQDVIRSDAKDVVKSLKKLGFKLYIVSGDRKEPTAKIASKLGIVDFEHSTDPKGKFAFLSKLAKDGHKTLMVGDGLNDAAALKAAFVSISPSSSIEIAQTSSDVVFQGEPLKPVIESYTVALKSEKLVKQNFMLSLAYNAITVPVAMMGFINPIIAAVAMSSSSIMVVLNSMRIRK